jgi:Cu2+-exporting ATPase
LHGTIDAETYYVGSPEYVARETSLSLDAARLEEWRAGGASLVLLASTRAWLAAFSFEDPLRPGARRLLDDLRRLGGSVTLLTGDHVAAAQRVAGELAIDDARANLRPADKLAAIRRLQADGAVVAMIGDGVNDAPVLAGADVSVAMGGAAHVSVAAADTVLLHNDLARLGEAVATARHARTVIRENLAWAVVYNVVAVPAAALGFVTPLLAAVGMSVSSLAVVLNAMRLLRRPAPEQ